MGKGFCGTLPPARTAAPHRPSPLDGHYDVAGMHGVGIEMEFTERKHYVRFGIQPIEYISGYA